MRRLRALVLGVGLLGLVAVLVPIWFLHHVATRVIGGRRSGHTTSIERVAASDTSIRAVMAAGRPVIVEGLVDQLGLSEVATPAGLERVAGDQTIDVTSYAAAAPYFLYSGGYDTSVVERERMTVREFLQAMFVRGVAADTVVYQLFGPRSLDGEIGGVLQRFDTAIGPATDLATEPRFSGVWVGSPGAVTPLHHDAWPGVLFQTHGTKRVTMYAPSDRTNLYFRSPLRGAGRWSDLPGRSADADPGAFPRLGRADRHTGELRPGDGLYIPPFWAHEMEALEANISVPFRFAGPRSTYLNPGFLRPATELLRKQFAAVGSR